MKTGLRFNPDKVAYFEKAGWEAYYDRDWPRAFRLMAALNREQFHMSPWTALLAALDIVRASMAFAPLEGNDVPKATRYIRSYYEKARRSVEIKADAGTLARLELDYWVVHRRLAIERMQDHDLDNGAPMVASLANLHAALFGIAPEAARRSAELRAQAVRTVDRITGRYSTDVEEDWRQVEAYLQQAYQAIVSA